MSEHPLTPQNLLIIVCAANDNQIDDAMKAYGSDAEGVTVVKVKTVADAITAQALYPAATPWCILNHADEFAIDALRWYFGNAITLADCLSMTPNDYAIHPSRFT